MNNTLTDNNARIIKYNLSKNENYYSDHVFINNVSFYFFDTYNDYKKSLIFSDRKITKNIFSVSSELLSDISGEDSYIDSNVIRLSSGRNFALFVNKENNPVLSSDSLREAISLVIDTDTIISSGLKGYALNISSDKETAMTERIAEAKKILSSDFTVTDESGTIVLSENKTKKAVAIQLSILESSEFKNIAEIIKQNLAVLGINTEVVSYEEHDLVENTVRGRNFEVLLFGYQTDVHISDLYYFFHSSQTVDPGINISNFSNSDADKLILNLRKNISDTDREEQSAELHDLIVSDHTYIPLYSPDYLYIMDSRIQNFNITTLNSRESRFQNIAN